MDGTGGSEEKLSFFELFLHMEMDEERTFLGPQTTSFLWMFGETPTISYTKVWNHPIETTIYKWLFGVPG